MRDVHRFEHRNNACPACCWHEVHQNAIAGFKLCSGRSYRSRSYTVDGSPVQKALGVSKPFFFTCPVGSIFNGDTIEVLRNGRAERIRLNSIDCPEKGKLMASA